MIMKQLYFLSGVLSIMLVLGSLLTGCGQVVKSYHGNGILASSAKQIEVNKTTLAQALKLLGPATFVDPMLPNVHVFVKYHKEVKILGKDSLKNVNLWILKFNKQDVLINFEHCILSQQENIVHNKKETPYEAKERYNILSQLGKALLENYGL